MQSVGHIVPFLGDIFIFLEPEGQYYKYDYYILRGAIFIAFGKGGVNIIQNSGHNLHPSWCEGQSKQIKACVVCILISTPKDILEV